MMSERAREESFCGSLSLTPVSVAALCALPTPLHLVSGVPACARLRRNAMPTSAAVARGEEGSVNASPGYTSLLAGGYVHFTERRGG